jgi:hypothetical protein
MQLSTVRFWKFFIQFFIFWFQTNEKKTNFLHEFIEFKENVLQKFSVKINKLFYRFFSFCKLNICMYGLMNSALYLRTLPRNTFNRLQIDF